MTDSALSTAEVAAVAPEVSVIVPARNEEDNLAACLRSLVAQENVSFEVVVVDDHSTDRTREIAESFPGVCVVDAGPLPPRCTGKNNAVICGARKARGAWLLFTDADTVHSHGSLAKSLDEAKQNAAAMLSYSPKQIVETFWEMAVMPVVFAELASRYRVAEVNDPASRVAAANGQYILIRREAYESVGGHAAIGTDLLEDVALARKIKQAGGKLLFRYGGDAVQTRMYRSFSQLREGWTKNLTLLFPDAGWTAFRTFLLWLVPWMFFALAASHILNSAFAIGCGMIAWLMLAARIRRSNFSFPLSLLGAIAGIPMFTYLLLRSKRAHQDGGVVWKGRTYGSEAEVESHAITTKPHGLSHTQS